MKVSAFKDSGYSRVCRLRYKVVKGTAGSRSSIEAFRLALSRTIKLPLHGLSSEPPQVHQSPKTLGFGCTVWGTSIHIHDPPNGKLRLVRDPHSHRTHRRRCRPSPRWRRCKPRVLHFSQYSRLQPANPHPEPRKASRALKASRA